MKKIAVFENEIAMVEGAYKAFNILYHNEAIKIDYFASSQEGEPFSSLAEYSAIVVDIDLSLRSNLDGINLIKQLLPHIEHERIFIMTGLSDVEDKLTANGIPKLKIIPKPITFDILNETISPVLV